MRYSQLRSSTSCGRSKKRRRTGMRSPIRVVLRARLASLAAVASPSQRPSHCPRQPPASVSGALTVQLWPRSNQSNPIRSNPAKSLTSKPRPTTGFSLATSCLWLLNLNSFCKAKRQIFSGRLAGLDHDGLTCFAWSFVAVPICLIAKFPRFLARGLERGLLKHFLLPSASALQGSQRPSQSIRYRCSVPPLWERVCVRTERIKKIEG